MSDFGNGKMHLLEEEKIKLGKLFGGLIIKHTLHEGTENEIKPSTWDDVFSYIEELGTEAWHDGYDNS